MGRAKKILQSIKSPEESASRESYGSRALFAEWKQDHAMAKERHETGREPDSQAAGIESLHPRDAADFYLTSRKPTKEDRKVQKKIQRLWDREFGIDR